MEERKDKLISACCMTAAGLSYPLICIWYIGIPLAVLSVILWLYQRRHYERNRVADVGGVLGVIMVGTVALVILVFAIYFGFISANDQIDWREILTNTNLFQEEG